MRRRPVVTSMRWVDEMEAVCSKGGRNKPKRTCWKPLDVTYDIMNLQKIWPWVHNSCSQPYLAGLRPVTIRMMIMINTLHLYIAFIKFLSKLKGMCFLWLYFSFRMLILDCFNLKCEYVKCKLLAPITMCLNSFRFLPYG